MGTQNCLNGSVSRGAAARNDDKDDGEDGGEEGRQSSPSIPRRSEMSVKLNETEAHRGDG